MNMFVSRNHVSAGSFLELQQPERVLHHLHDWFSDHLIHHEHLFEENLLKEASLRAVEGQKAAA